MSDRKKVLVLDPAINEKALAMLAEKFDMEKLPAHSPEDEIIAHAEGVEAFYVRLCNVTRKVFENVPSLKIVSRHGVGFDMVDVDAATDHGVVVTNTPGANATAVAECVLGGMLSVYRGIHMYDSKMKAGESWPRDAFMGNELEGKTMGIIGLGQIGAKVAKFCTAFDMKVIGYDPFFNAEQAKERGAEYMQPADVLANADFITFHVPLTPETKYMVNAESIKTMRKGAVIVNMARGPVVNEAALVDGIKSGHLGGAVLDVFESEPLELDSPLRSMDNVVLLPHTGGQTHESGLRVAMWSAECVVDELEGRRPKFVVNPKAYDNRK